MTERDIRQLVSLYNFFDGFLGESEMSETVATILGSIKTCLIDEMQIRLETDVDVLKDKNLSLEEKVRKLLYQLES